MNFHLITHVHEILQTIGAGLEPIMLSNSTDVTIDEDDDTYCVYEGLDGV